MLTFLPSFPGNGLNPSAHSTITSKRMSVGPGRVSSIQFINAHDRGLVLAGYDDGAIRIWKNSLHSQSSNANNLQKSQKDLVTAFQAMSDISGRSSKLYGLITAWHQKSQTIIVGGESKYLRLWDVEKELRTVDIATGSDFVVSHISCASSGIFAAGFGDGIVKMYDRRLRDNIVMSYREHSQPLLTLCIRNDCEKLISGW